MKVALVADGGLDAHVGDLAAAMSGLGHRVTVYARRDGQDFPDCVDNPRGYTVRRVPAGPAAPVPDHEILEWIGDFARGLAHWWEIDRPHVTHAHSWMPGIANQLAARAHGIPTVQTFHHLGVVERRRHDDVGWVSPVRLKLETLIARHAGWVTAICTDQVAELTRMGCPRSRISMVPHGVDLEAFCTEGTVAPRGGRNRIVAAGMSLQHRGFETVIDALPAIPDVELVIAGGPDPRRLIDDPQACRLRRLATVRGVEDRMALTGAIARHDMPALLRSADVVTCTPRHAHFGTVVLEAMACGVPVAASATGGALDTVVDGVTGRLVTPGRPRECAEVVAQMLRDSFRCRSLGLAGRDRARARYCWDRVCADTLRIYQRLTGSEGMRPLVGTG